MAELMSKGAAGLKKAAPRPSQTPEEEDGRGGFLAELAQKARTRKESNVDISSQMDEQMSSRPPLPNALSALALEIQQASLSANESRFKAAEPPPPPPPQPPAQQPAQPQFQPAPPPALGSQPVQHQPQQHPAAAPVPAAAVAAASEPAADLAIVKGDPNRPIAPTVSETGKAIPAWKQKILQRKLDAAHAKVMEAAQAMQAKESRWVGVPAWKRAMIEKKEAAALSGGGDGGSDLEALATQLTVAPPPAADAPAAFALPAFKLKKSDNSAVLAPPAPYVPPTSPPKKTWGQQPKAAPPPAAASVPVGVRTHTIYAASSGQPPSPPSPPSSTPQPTCD
jgi:hypothetical protein